MWWAHWIGSRFQVYSTILFIILIVLYDEYNLLIIITEIYIFLELIHLRGPLWGLVGQDIWHLGMPASTSYAVFSLSLSRSDWIFLPIYSNRLITPEKKLMWILPGIALNFAWNYVTFIQWFEDNFYLNMASLVAQMVKSLPAVQETWVRFLGCEDPLEKGMATHSSILAWRIPLAEEPGRL